MKKTATFLKENDHFLLIGHKNADGDCFGTMIAFARILSYLNKSFKIIIADPIPDNYHFLFEKNDFSVLNSFDCNGESLIFFECNNFERSGIEIGGHYTTVLNFDHHPGNDYFADINVVDESASSVGEMAVSLLRDEFPDCMDPFSANALYTAIHTDTGGFAYSNTTSDTFRASAFLLEKGADPSFVCTHVYDTMSLKRLNLTGYFMKNLKVIYGGLAGYGVITLEDFKTFDCTKKDTENFSNYPRSIKGVEIGLFLSEIDKNTFKVSLRSKGNYIVNNVAAEYGGGGHKFAAGCVIEGQPDRIAEELAEKILS